MIIYETKSEAEEARVCKVGLRAGAVRACRPGIKTTLYVPRTEEKTHKSALMCVIEWLLKALFHELGFWIV